MKRLLSGILICALALTLGVSAFADAAVSLSDVQPGSWYYNEVSEMVAAGFIDGYEDGTFQPDRTVTVAEAVRTERSSLTAPSPWPRPSP